MGDAVASDSMFSNITIKTNSMMGGAILATPIMVRALPGVHNISPYLAYAIGGVGAMILNTAVDEGGRGFHNPTDIYTSEVMVPAAVNGLAGGVVFAMLLSKSGI